MEYSEAFMVMIKAGMIPLPIKVVENLIDKAKIKPVDSEWRLKYEVVSSSVGWVAVLINNRFNQPILTAKGWGIYGKVDAELGFNTQADCAKALFLADPPPKEMQ